MSEKNYNLEIDNPNVDKLHQGDEIHHHHYGWRKYIVILSITVCIAICSLVIWQNHKPDKPKSESFIPFPMQEEKGGSILKAVDHYNAQRFFNALQEFERTNEKSDFILFYMSNCHLSLNSFDKARECLNLIDKNSSEFTEEVEWLIALSYYYENDLDTAKIHLTNIQVKKGRFKKDAQDLMLKIFDKEKN